MIQIVLTLRPIRLYLACRSVVSELAQRFANSDDPSMKSWVMHGCWLLYGCMHNCMLMRQALLFPGENQRLVYQSKALSSDVGAKELFMYSKYRMTWKEIGLHSIR